MRLLHTADWHLGRTLCGQSFQEEQEWLLSGPFLDLVKDTRPDAVIIAGDVYDRAVPPADAVELLDDVLGRIVRGLRTPVVMIAGNHDDPRRLSFGAALLAGAGLHVARSALAEVFPFEDRHGPVSIVAAGYGSPALVSELLGDGSAIGDHDSAFSAIAARARALIRPQSRSVLVAHAFVQGGLTSESERVLQVGGSGAVSAAHLDGFHYVALGHLHRSQAMDGGRIAYSGSPLAYSFSEAGAGKSVSLVAIGRDGAVTSEPIALVPRRRLRTLRGTLDDVLRTADGPGREDWLQVTLTEPAFGAKPLLNERYPSVLDLRFDIAPSAAGRERPQHGLGADPLAMLEAFWDRIGAGPLAPEERALATRAIAAASRDEG
ncbi:exonuclease SbcCD subunit D C-terminal domain-containing protein [Elioraea sp.]|uniref:metallophosphoesterase family protein n=1 Tax=Elioraea sp. TaxID=2185103 RepID=UPI0025C67F8E|nr:exonuclease SbcCD subunit D C-terminal domain-containing protein [Elioraea sp.]